MSIYKNLMPEVAVVIKGKTKSGYEYAIRKARLENYELIEALNEVEANPIMLPKVVNMLLGKEQAEELKDYLRDEEGLVSTEKLSNEIMDIFQGQEEAKNS